MGCGNYKPLLRVAKLLITFDEAAYLCVVEALDGLPGHRTSASALRAVTVVRVVTAVRVIVTFASPPLPCPLVIRVKVV